ncbi:MAG: transposase [Beijerinckiaceae bacterium]|nr:transposase [Beijerinckiaceae bacterium]
MQEILGRERRRRWSDEEKTGIVAESFRPGVSVSWVARRHGVSASQLFNWRKAARQASTPESPATDLIPVVVAAPSGAPDGACEAANETGHAHVDARIEIAFPNGRRLSAPAGLDRRVLDQLIASVARG